MDSADLADAFFALYRYIPSLPLAAVSVACFGILTLWHGARLLQKRSLYLTPFVIGGLFETLGYAGRIWSHYDLNSLGGFIIQSLLILLAPALFAASIYMILGRLIHTLRADTYSLVPLRWLTKVFVIGDVVSFLTQSLGGGVQAAGTLELYEIGEKVIIAGLFVQIFVFGFFMITTIVFHRRILARPTSQSAENVIPWMKYLWILYGVSVLIMVRSLFRVVEYLQGNAGYLIRREYFLYIFDAILMFLVMVLMLFMGPITWEDLGKEDVELMPRFRRLSKNTQGSTTPMEDSVR
ncbi:RTA1 like domain containing protein [Naviculisporaceae sp. PSN 640]